MSKLLEHFLQEQQEPFALEVYLLERGYNLNSTSNFCSAKLLNKSASRTGLKKRKYSIPSCSKFIKGVFTRLVSSNNSEKIKNSRNGDQSKISRGEEEIAEDDKFSTASSTTVFNSCSESDVEDAHFSKADTGQKGNLLSEKEVVADRKLKWRAVEESKQHSPVSVLEETESEPDDGSPIHYKEYNGESSTKKPTNYSFQELQELIRSNSSSQYMKNKRALQQTKQLLFDCVREVVENHRKNDKKGENLKKIMEPEELWKNVCENVWLWSQESINETNIIDFLAFAQEWDDYEQQKKDISMEVGDAVLEHIINEILVNFVS
ncbi:uncharacterized protein Fot_22041 [Forsythia ovata]|uniref:DUF4378 domain-containing protein n=1 Tax=Forsythia ovata TaxID=205694 RepID=A0ABD1UWK1_9LAMI